MDKKHVGTDEVIDGIYAAVLESSSVVEMQQLLSNTLDAPASTMIRLDNGMMPISWIGFDPSATESYGAHYCRTDPWIAAGMSLPGGIGINVERLVPRASYLECEFYRDFMQKHGDATQLMGVMFTGGPARYSLTFMRVKGQRDFDDAQERRFALWAPHLERAFATRDRLDRQRPDPLRSDQDAVHLLVTADLRVCWMSRDDLTAIPGMVLRCRPNSIVRVEAARPDSQTALLRAVHDATRRSPPLSSAVPLGEDFILVDPCPSQGGSEPLALLHLPDRRAVEARAVERATGLFHLTSAEAALCRRLMHGDTIEMHAAAMNLSTWTVRTHLRNAFGKTGTSRQAELVSLLYRLAR